MEIWFYHLERQSLEEALPKLIEKGVDRNWRVIVETVDDLRMKAIDDLLWTYRPESFLPHAAAGDRLAANQPVLVTRTAENPNGAALRIYVEGAEIGVPAEAGYERIILLFDGRQEVELEGARRQWARLKTEGFDLAYWQQKPEGGWERQN